MRFVSLRSFVILTNGEILNRLCLLNARLCHFDSRRNPKRALSLKHAPLFDIAAFRFRSERREKYKPVVMVVVKLIPKELNAFTVVEQCSILSLLEAIQFENKYLSIYTILSMFY
jgi:hypothetical protein